MARLPMIREPIFEETRTVGNVAKECVRALLESGGYAVYPFGYESYLTHIKDLMHQRRLERTEVTEQLASMPDMVVVDDVNKTIELVEVKYRNRKPNNVSSDLKVIARIKKYWPNSIIVWVLPYEDVFYACRANESKIMSEKLGIIDIDLTGYSISKLFAKLTQNDVKMKRLQELAIKMLKAVDVSIRFE